MSQLRRKDTVPEVTLRRALFAAGLRYRVNHPVPGMPRRTVDIAFTRARVAVFVDGCFWHSCPHHATKPRANSEWWAAKLSRNTERDRETTAHLEARGWTVVRLWEHEDVSPMRAAVIATLRSRTVPPDTPLPRGGPSK